MQILPCYFWEIFYGSLITKRLQVTDSEIISFVTDFHKNCKHLMQTSQKALKYLSRSRKLIKKPCKLKFYKSQLRESKVILTRTTFPTPLEAQRYLSSDLHRRMGAYIIGCVICNLYIVG